MSNPSNFSNDRVAPVNSKVSAEAHKPESAATKAAEVTAAEKLVVDKPLPESDYPYYRIQPGQKIR